MYHTKKQILEGITGYVSARITERNTVERTLEDGTIIIRLHLTDIVTISPDGTVKLTAGEWRTRTTKARMVNYLPHGWTLYTDKSTWYLEENSNRYYYHDGVEITENTCTGKLCTKKKEKALRVLKRRARKYAKDYIVALRAGDLLMPDSGDCFMCQSILKTKEASHIISHIEEKYYVPSLLVRATEEFGLSQVAQSCLTVAWDPDHKGCNLGRFGDIGYKQLEKALYRYCCRCLGFHA